jgi:hypothetical protein
VLSRLPDKYRPPEKHIEVDTTLYLKYLVLGQEDLPGRPGNGNRRQRTSRQ